MKVRWSDTRFDVLRRRPKIGVLCHLQPEEQPVYCDILSKLKTDLTIYSDHKGNKEQQNTRR